MNQNFSVKRWLSNYSLEEIKLDVVMFWVQIKGFPLNLCMETSVKRLSEEVGEFLEMENLEKAMGFLRVKILMDIVKPMIIGCWLPISEDIDSWVEF